MNINPLWLFRESGTTCGSSTIFRRSLVLLCSFALMSACSEDSSVSKEQHSTNSNQDETDTAEQDPIPVVKPVETEPEPNLPSYTLKFAPDSTNLDGPAIRLSAKMVKDDLLTATVTGYALTDVFGIAFHVLFDDSMLEFVDAQPADILTNTLAKGVYGASLREPGLIVYGGARFHPPTGNGGPITYTGMDLDSVELLTLTFRVKGAGTTELHFADQGHSLRNDKLEWESASWVGGTLTVNLSE